jgi:hypothetical protein
LGLRGLKESLAVMALMELMVLTVWTALMALRARRESLVRKVKLGLQVLLAPKAGKGFKAKLVQQVLRVKLVPLVQGLQVVG